MTVVLRSCRNALLLLWLSPALLAGKPVSPGSAPPLPVTGTRVVGVATELQLQAAMANLRPGDTVLLADGTPRPRGARSDIGADEFTTNAPPPITSMRLSGSNVVVGLLTFPGESYDLLRANDLAGGIWTVIAAGVAGTGGVVPLKDTTGATQGKAFYRARLSP